MIIHCVAHRLEIAELNALNMLKENQNLKDVLWYSTENPQTLSLLVLNKGSERAEGNSRGNGRISEWTNKTSRYKVDVSQSHV